MKSLCAWTVVGAVLSAAAMPFASKQDGQGEGRLAEGVEIAASDWDYILEASVAIDDLEMAAANLKGEALYLRLTAGKSLLIELTEPNEKVETLGYKWQGRSHDLNVRAGRAAWFLEHGFGISVPSVMEVTTRIEQQSIADDAQRQFEAFRRGALEAFAEMRPESQNALQQRYQRLLQAGSSDEHGCGWGMTAEAEPHMRSMLREWFPIGKAFADLETIIGRKAKRVEGLTLREFPNGTVYMYTFGGGGSIFSPTKYLFVVVDGAINAVIRRPSV